jgi:hypothetical protein
LIENITPHKSADKALIEDNAVIAERVICKAAMTPEEQESFRRKLAEAQAISQAYIAEHSKPITEREEAGLGFYERTALRNDRYFSQETAPTSKFSTTLLLGFILAGLMIGGFFLYGRMQGGSSTVYAGTLLPGQTTVITQPGATTVHVTHR